MQIQLALLFKNIWSLNISITFTGNSQYIIISHFEYGNCLQTAIPCSNLVSQKANPCIYQTVLTILLKSNHQDNILHCSLLLLELRSPVFPHCPLLILLQHSVLFLENISPLRSAICFHPSCSAVTQIFAKVFTHFFLFWSLLKSHDS